MQKRAFRTLVALALASLILIVPAYAETAEVTGGEVNIREGPGTNYAVVGCLKAGSTVTVTDRSNSSWYAVDSGGTTGFMSSLYLSVYEQDSPVELEPVYIGDSGSGSSSASHVNAMYVRFRSGPGGDYSILGEYNKGKAVSVTGSYGDWVACTIDGQAGYVFSQYISQGSAAEYDPYSPNASYEVISPPATAAPTTAPTPTPTPTPTPGNQYGGYEIISPPAATAAPTAVPTAVPTTAPTPTAVPTAAPTATPTAAPTAAPAAGTAVSGTITGDYVRFRTGPGTGYSIINTYNKGKTLSVTGESGGWTACTIDGQAGYVFSQYVQKQATVTEVLPTATATPGPTATATPNGQATATPAPTATAAPIVESTGSKAGYISGNNVRMRGGPSMNAEILGELFFGNAVTITGVSGDWTAVTYKETAGFVYSSYVKEGSYSYTDSTAGSTGSAAGQEIAKYALQYVGYNYSWGGTSPDTGFDCSGLVYYVYQHFGYTLNRVAADQAMNGVHVDTLEPGDILCFYSGSSYIGHSGIYIGDGKFVHAANSATGVIVTELSGYYSTRGYEARRIVG